MRKDLRVFLLCLLVSCCNSNQPVNESSVTTPAIVIQEIASGCDTNLTIQATPESPIEWEKASELETVKTEVNSLESRQNVNMLAEHSRMVKQQPVSTTKVSLHPDSVQLVYCPQGTVVKVFPNSFISKRTGKPVSGLLKLVVKEFYDKTDIIKEGLSTMSNGQLLESGGMVKIEAFAANEPCELMEGRTIGVAFKKTKDFDRMQLFNGVEEGKNINWIRSKDYFKPARGGCGRPTYSYYYSEINLQALNNHTIERYLKNNLVIPASIIEAGTSATVEVNFVLDTAGNLSFLAVSKRGVKMLDRTAIHMVEKLPASLLKKVAEYQNNFKISIHFGMYNLPNARKRKIISQAKELELELSNKAVVYKRRKYNQRVSSFLKQMFKKPIRNTWSSQSDDFQKVYAAFASKSLGYINCDRFYQNPNPKVALVVKEKLQENMEVYLVFNNIRSVMYPQLLPNGYLFSGIPLGQSVTIVAVKVENGESKMAINPLNITGSNTITLKFEKEDIPKLKKALSAKAVG